MYCTKTKVVQSLLKYTLDIRYVVSIICCSEDNDHQTLNQAYLMYSARFASLVICEILPSAISVTLGCYSNPPEGKVYVSDGRKSLSFQLVLAIYCSAAAWEGG
jgi:hypothetical protein